MPRMSQFSFLYAFFQPAEGGVIAQSAEHLHFFGGNVVMVFEIIRQPTVYLNLTDEAGAAGIAASDELGAAQPAEEFLFGGVDNTTELDAFRTDFLLGADGR